MPVIGITTVFPWIGQFKDISVSHKIETLQINFGTKHTGSVG
jgi:hypothetical protein